jgi:hypothetical protein
MDLELSPAESEQFAKALLSAYPSKADLEQLVFYRLGERLNQLVEGGNYAKVVADLIEWASGQGRTDELLTKAREKNPGNPQLHRFEELIRRNRNAQRTLDQPAYPLASAQNARAVDALTPAERTQLIDALLALPVSKTFMGRSTLLNGIPGDLNRSSDNARLDFDLIIDQLSHLGQLSSGNWPLLMLIDNALRYGEPYKSLARVLQSVSRVLVNAYEEM